MSMNHAEDNYLKEKNFWKATFIRAIRTVAQTAVATIGTAVVLTDVNWVVVGSSALLAGVLSVLTSVATGLPEVPESYYIESEVPPEDD